MDFLKPEEVANELRVTRTAVYNWLRTGMLRGCKAGRHWRVPREAVEAFLTSTPRTAWAAFYRQAEAVVASSGEASFACRGAGDHWTITVTNPQCEPVAYAAESRESAMRVLRALMDLSAVSVIVMMLVVLGCTEPDVRMALELDRSELAEIWMIAEQLPHLASRYENVFTEEHYQQIFGP